MLTTFQTLVSTGGSDPPAYVPEREAGTNPPCGGTCGVMNPKLTAESVPIMNASFVVTK
jgi:hypothetical protein